MSFLTELKARRKRGPGGIEVYFQGDDKPIVVPLKYPNAAAQAEVMAFINNIDDDVTGAESLEQNTQLTYLIIRACIDEDEVIEDEDLAILVRESGGFDGVLSKRCSQLIGFGGDADYRTRAVKGTKRGR